MPDHEKTVPVVVSLRLLAHNKKVPVDKNRMLVMQHDLMILWSFALQTPVISCILVDRMYRKVGHLNKTRDECVFVLGFVRTFGAK